MKKILGLDLGTNSIGWALIEVNEVNIPIRIVSMGARIIPLSADDRDQFQSGQAISKNQERTTARTQRKGYNRKQLKKSDDFKYSLTKVLKQLNILPSLELIQLPVLDLWKLRNDAASENETITPEQLGRVLYMLNQKRGYKSARSEDNQDKKDTDYVAEVKSRYAQLKVTGKTLGQYFYTELNQANEANQYFHVKKKVYPREAYIEEFDAIMKVQKERHSFLTDEVISKVRDEIIYYQRPLKSQKGLVNVCEFEGFETTYTDKVTQKQKTIFTGPKVAPKTSPLFQLCKIWETVNNLSLKVKNPDGSKYKWGDRFPSPEEKQEIVNRLWSNANLSYADMLKILQLKKEDVYANKQILKGLHGNITYAEITKVIRESEHLRFEASVIPSTHKALIVDNKTGEILEEKDSLQLAAKLEQEPLYKLWHTIYSIKDLDECRQALMKRFKFSESAARELSKLDFNKQGFGNKSNKAMRKILPYLFDGYDYSQACSLAGYNHSDSLTTTERENRVTADQLKLLPKNSLRQPVVEKILNQMINVVNAVIGKYGKPDEIRIELARELKQSKDERNEADIQNSNNKKLNDEVALRLSELGLPATKRYIQKYKFIFPSRGQKLKDAQVVNQCIYCGESFNLSQALSGDNFDVDHIVPKALLFDDSQTNKVLVHRSCNANKTNQTAYDYIAKRGEVELDRYLHRVDDWYKRGIISYSKMQRLKVSFEEYTERKKHKKETEADKKLWENFIARQLRETQYIARKSREILNQVCNNVTATEGTVTAKLRELWGWDDVLMNLQLPKYKGIGQTVIKEWTSEHGKRKHQKEEIANWTKRDDHRHHAIDALVIACTQQGFIQRINTLSASDVKDEMNKAVEQAKVEYNEKLTLLEKYLTTYKPFTTAQVEKEAEKVLVSFKAGKKVATTGVRKVKVDGSKRIVQSGIIVPRGALHESGYYGKINISSTGGKKEEHIIKKYKVGISAQDHIFTGKETYTVKKDKNGNEKIDDKVKKVLDAIIDTKIRDVILERLNRGFEAGKDYKSDVKKALNNFKDLDNDPLWFNKDKGIKIVSVKLKTGLKDSVVPINHNDAGKAITFVKTGSNHHIAIYKDKEDNPVQHVCTFWHAVERKKNKLPVLIKNSSEVWSEVLQRNLPQSFLDKLPSDKMELQHSLQENEMFVLGLGKEIFEEAIKTKNTSQLSKNLFLVWSVSLNKYWFRHHLETKNSELKKTVGARETNRFIEVSSVDGFLKLNPIKVRLNHLGEISKVGE